VCHCEDCTNQNPEGVSSLLAGKQLALEPAILNRKLRKAGINAILVKHEEIK
jgi:hypothetical protein